MKRQILILIAVWVVALSGLVLYLNRGDRTVQEVASENSSSSTAGDKGSSSSSSSLPPEPPKYQCLGKTRCSEMTSCEEARFYLQNCPGTKMDGDHDGKPCEDWCGH